MHILFSSHQLPESITSNHRAHLYLKQAASSSTIMELHFVYSDLSMKSKAEMMVKPMTTVIKVLNN